MIWSTCAQYLKTTLTLLQNINYIHYIFLQTYNIIYTTFNNQNKKPYVFWKSTENCIIFMFQWQRQF